MSSGGDDGSRSRGSVATIPLLVLILVSASVASVRGCTNANLGSSWAGWPMPNPPRTSLRHPARYSITPAGTVHDDVTCLEWQRTLSAATYNFEQAKAYCKSLSLNGNGWHLPSRVELLSITDFTRSGPAIDTATFPKTPSAFFWTSTPWAVGTYVGTTAIPRAWIVNFYEGLSSNGAFRSASYRARCVRSPAPGGRGAPRYRSAGKGQIRDLATGLVWQRTGSSSTTSAADAAAACGRLALGGYKWRLPSIKEIATTVNDTKVAPAINLSVFPGTASRGYYWTSSVAAPSPAMTWGLNYLDGFTNYRNVATGYVRCVR